MRGERPAGLPGRPVRHTGGPPPHSLTTQAQTGSIALWYSAVAGYTAQSGQAVMLLLLTRETPHPLESFSVGERGELLFWLSVHSLSWAELQNVLAGTAPSRYFIPAPRDALPGRVVRSAGFHMSSSKQFSMFAMLLMNDFAQLRPSPEHRLSSPAKQQQVRLHERHDPARGIHHEPGTGRAGRGGWTWYKADEEC